MKRPLYLLISCLSCLAVFMLLDFIVYGDQSPQYAVRHVLRNAACQNDVLAAQC
jgi:hypothetical protein